MPLCTESFTHRGHRLVYDVYGEGDQVIVYMHGLLLDSDLNRGIADALASEGNRVVLIDLLGHGRSDKPRRASEYRIDAYADQVVGLLDHLEVSQAVLGGMSLGANVSLFAASEHPERVRGMVLEMPVLEWAVPSAAMTFVPLLVLMHYGAPVVRLLGAGVGRLPETRFDPVNSFLHAATTPPEVIAAILHGVLVGPVAPTREQREAIDVPTLVLAHRLDLIHPFDDAERLTRQLPNASLVRARSPIELRLFPDRLTEEIAAFTSAAWRTGRGPDDRRHLHLEASGDL